MPTRTDTERKLARMRRGQTPDGPVIHYLADGDIPVPAQGSDLGIFTVQSDVRFSGGQDTALVRRTASALEAVVHVANGPGRLYYVSVKRPTVDASNPYFLHIFDVPQGVDNSALGGDAIWRATLPVSSPQFDLALPGGLVYREGLRLAMSSTAPTFTVDGNNYLLDALYQPEIV